MKYYLFGSKDYREDLIDKPIAIGKEINFVDSDPLCGPLRIWKRLPPFDDLINLYDCIIWEVEKPEIIFEENENFISSKKVKIIGGGYNLDEVYEVLFDWIMITIVNNWEAPQQFYDFLYEHNRNMYRLRAACAKVSGKPIYLQDIDLNTVFLNLCTDYMYDMTVNEDASTFSETLEIMFIKGDLPFLTKQIIENKFEELVFSLIQ